MRYYRVESSRGWRSTDNYGSGMAIALPAVEDAHSLHDRLKEIFTSSAPGRDDAAAMQEVRRLCQEAKRRVRDPHCHAQLSQLERYARYFFSSEAHQQWSRDTAFGGGGLRGLILQLLNAFELRVLHLESQRLVAAHGLSKAVSADRRS
jgi:hypothetical protein